MTTRLTHMPPSLDGKNMITKAFASAATAMVVAVISACNAHAEPPRFPDFGGYTPVNVADYEVNASTPGIPATEVFFVTPDGINCSFQSGQAQCTGNNFPGIPPAAPTPSGSSRVNWIGTESGLQQIAPSAGAPTGVKTLAPLHSITVDGAICGVDNTGTTACKDPQGHGFVLSPHGSGWLPHV
jgi:hypothetical protein